MYENSITIIDNVRYKYIFTIIFFVEMNLQFQNRTMNSSWAVSYICQLLQYSETISCAIKFQV